ncbi:MAG TPA: RNA polymerase sigma factor SigJ [Ktedonobacteraceae bacterium]|jgi:RNA polymerase sigma-70 factor (ECF subfamily)
METRQETVVRSYQALLFSIAYHMLGSVMDAEDCVQEAFVQWYACREPIEHPRAYLCTLVTRRCIDLLRSARAQRETYVGLWLPAPLVDTMDPSALSERSEALSLALLQVLERLSPLERAVFLLRQVFDYDYAEIAPIVGKSAASCRQVLHRARQHLAARPVQAQPTRAQQQQVFARFLQACSGGEMEGLLRLLSDDIVLRTDSGGKVSAARNPLSGPRVVARYLLGLQQKVFALFQVAVHPALVNGQPGLVCYLLEDARALRVPGQMSRERSRFLAAWEQQAVVRGGAIFVLALTCQGEQVRQIDIVVNPQKLRHIPAIAAPA